MFDNWEKAIGGFVLFCFLFGGSCGSDKVFETDSGEKIEATEYGIFNTYTADPRVEYRTNWENLIAGGIMYQSVAAPIWIVGFKLKEPVKLKSDAYDINVVVSTDKEVLDAEIVKLAEEVASMTDDLVRVVEESGLGDDVNKIVADIRKEAVKISKDLKEESDKASKEVAENFVAKVKDSKLGEEVEKLTTTTSSIQETTTTTTIRKRSQQPKRWWEK